MNGIEKIVRRLDAEAQAAIDAVLSEAKEKEAALKKESAAKAEKLAADLRQRGERAAAEREERLVSVARMEARKISLAAKQEAVDEAFDKALESLCSAPDEEYINTSAKLLAKASPDGEGEVVFSEKVREKIGERIVEAANRLTSGRLKLSDETRDIKGGFILVKGSVEVNCSYETLVRLQKGETLGEVAKLLFPEV